MEFDCFLYGLYIGSNQGVGLLMRLYRFSLIAFGDALIKDIGYTIYKDAGYTIFKDAVYTIYIV
jgi:hypothetical protein